MGLWLVVFLFCASTMLARHQSPYRGIWFWVFFAAWMLLFSEVSLWQVPYKLWLWGLLCAWAGLWFYTFFHRKHGSIKCLEVANFVLPLTVWGVYVFSHMPDVSWIWRMHVVLATVTAWVSLFLLLISICAMLRSAIMKKGLVWHSTWVPSMVYLETIVWPSVYVLLLVLFLSTVTGWHLKAPGTSWIQWLPVGVWGVFFMMVVYRHMVGMRAYALHVIMGLCLIGSLLMLLHAYPYLVH